MSLLQLNIRLGLQLAVGVSAVVVLAIARLSAAHPYVELVSNFSPHLLVGLLVLLPLVVLPRYWPEASVLLVVIGVHALAVAPYLRTNVPPAAVGDTATVMQYNVLYFNEDIDAIAKEVLDGGADVVALHELTVLQWQHLEPRLENSYPFSIALPVDPAAGGRRGGGKALLSRNPITRVELDGFRSPPLAATTEVLGREVLAVALHPSPSRFNSGKIDERMNKIEAAAEAVADFDGPAIILADLNVAPTSYEYADFIDLLGWRDVRRSVGIAPTYPVGRMNRAGVAIDHILVSNDMVVHSYELGDGGGSDHRSLIATVSFDNERLA